MSETVGVRAAGEVTGQVVDVSDRTVDVTIPYNVVDSYGTVWLPGCFTRSLQDKLPPVVMHHDVSTVVGRVKSFRDTPTALHLTIQLADPDAVPNARAAQSLLREGVIDEVSFRFAPPTDVINDRRFGNAPCYRSTTIKEVSFVTIGSVPGARVLAVRSADDDDDYRFALDDLAAAEAAQQLEDEAQLTLAKLTLSGFHRRATAGVRAAIELAERDAEAEHQAAQERARVSRQLAAIDASSPDPHFVERHFGTNESWSLNPDSAMPDYPPGDLIAAALDRGMTEAEAIAAWRRKYGKTDDGKRHGNVPGISEYPPQDIITAATADGRMTAAEAIHRWRVKYGFEQA